jgi:RimJ/RimL family protein N-acetyltransferase
MIELDGVRLRPLRMADAAALYAYLRDPVVTELAQAHWGKGLMRQAVAAVLQWTFRQDQVDRVHAFVRVDHTRSERLLVRSGFVREGCLRSYRVCRGQRHDFHIYGLLRSNWACSALPSCRH